MNTENFLQENQENLNNILRPFQQELKRGQRLADFIQQCVRCLGRDDYLQLEGRLALKLDDTKPNAISVDVLDNVRVRRTWVAWPTTKRLVS